MARSHRASALEPTVNELPESCRVAPPHRRPHRHIHHCTGRQQPTPPNSHFVGIRNALQRGMLRARSDPKGEIVLRRIVLLAVVALLAVAAIAPAL